MSNKYLDHGGRFYFCQSDFIICGPQKVVYENRYLHDLNCPPQVDRSPNMLPTQFDSQDITLTETQQTSRMCQPTISITDSLIWKFSFQKVPCQIYKISCFEFSQGKKKVHWYLIINYEDLIWPFPQLTEYSKTLKLC